MLLCSRDIAAPHSYRAVMLPLKELTSDGLVEAAGIEPASRRKQNPKQVVLLPANALSS